MNGCRNGKRLNFKLCFRISPGGLRRSRWSDTTGINGQPPRPTFFGRRTGCQNWGKQGKRLPSIGHPKESGFGEKCPTRDDGYVLDRGCRCEPNRGSDTENAPRNPNEEVCRIRILFLNQSSYPSTHGLHSDRWARGITTPGLGRAFQVLPVGCQRRVRFEPPCTPRWNRAPGPAALSRPSHSDSLLNG